jgi:hypothetical protein
VAQFKDEEAPARSADFVGTIKEHLSNDKTVEVLLKDVNGKERVFFRVWTGKRRDTSNTAGADPAKDY